MCVLGVDLRAWCPAQVNVTFKDVAGVDEAKREIMEFVEFLKVRQGSAIGHRYTTPAC
jgi:ATP-dependent Zn protease